MGCNPKSCCRKNSNGDAILGTTIEINESNFKHIFTKPAGDGDDLSQHNGNVKLGRVYSMQGYQNNVHDSDASFASEADWEDEEE